MKKTVKEKRGITLVALVITIIVLLILAGITINLTVGQDGILTTAQQAGKNYVASASDEQADLDDLSDYLNEKVAAAGEKLKDLTKTVTVDGVETTVIIGEKISDGTGKTLPVPTGFYYVGGTVEKGAVISNNEADKDKYKGQTVVGTDLVGNQYVFIPCTIDGANGTLQYARTTSWEIEKDHGTAASKDELTLTGVTPSDTEKGNGMTETVLEE
jgi:competence protein ComGC